MKTNNVTPRNSGGHGAFTLVELLWSLAMTVVLSGVLSPMLTRGRNVSQSAVDLDNGRRMMAATALYASQNEDVLPYPGWGSIPAGLPGWAYTTTANEITRQYSSFGTMPDGISGPGRDKPPGDPDSAYQRQVPFFRGGQLGPIILNPKYLMCPKDVAEVTSLGMRAIWGGRMCKVTSYVWNVGIIEEGQRTIPHPMTAFRPGDILGWEVSEADPFFMNDSANQPYEGLTQRHGGIAFQRGVTYQDWSGSGLVFRMDGSASHMSWRSFVAMAGSSGGAEIKGIKTIPRRDPDNYLYIGPQKGRY